jgi:hypothetical protein
MQLYPVSSGKTACPHRVWGRDRVEPRALISGDVTLHAEESTHVLVPLLNECSRPAVLAVVHGTVHCGDRFLGHFGWWLGDFLFRCSSDFYHRR